MCWLVGVKRDEIKLKRQWKLISKMQFKLGKEGRKVVSSLHCVWSGCQVTMWSDTRFFLEQLC